MLRKACKRLVGRLSWKRYQCRKTATATAVAESVDHAAASGALQEPVLAGMERSNGPSATPEAEVPVQSYPANLEHGATKVFVPPVHFEDWSTPYLQIHSGKAASSDGTCTLMIPTVVRNTSSESDSGVCLDDGEIQLAEQECLEEEEEEDEELEEDEGEEEEEWECNCDECFFALCEEQLDDWRISAKDLSLEKVLSNEDGEVVCR